MGVSRNNFKNKMKQMAEQKPRFGFRKFPVGLASALIVAVFYSGAMPSSVKADVQAETETGTKTVSQIDQQNKKTNNQNSSKTANMSNQRVASMHTTTTTQDENRGQIKLLVQLQVGMKIVQSKGQLVLVKLKVKQKVLDRFQQLVKLRLLRNWNKRS